MEYAQRVERLSSMVEAGNILRGKWTDGHDRACLLAAISPECGEQETATACPASVMPQWLAYVTPMFDDETSYNYWPRFVRRYADLAGRWTALDAAAWNRLDYTLRKQSVLLARQYADPAGVAAIDAVVALHDREIAGDVVSVDDWSAAQRAAESAADSAAWSAAHRAAESAAESAADSAAWSAAGSAAQRAAWSAADSAAYDQLASSLLDAIEGEIAKVHGA